MKTQVMLITGIFIAVIVVFVTTSSTTGALAVLAVAVADRRKGALGGVVVVHFREGANTSVVPSRVGVQKNGGTSKKEDDTCQDTRIGVH